MNPIAKTDFLSLYLVGESDSGRTKIFFVRSAHDDYLGKISWFSPWRKYAFTPANDAVLFDATCLSQIATWCLEKTAEHKA